MANTLRKVSGLKVAYGGIKAVKGIDLEVHEGELISLIGSNGAGKTTTMKAVTGSLAFEGGDIEYMGKSIKGKGAWDLVKEGLIDFVTGFPGNSRRRMFRARSQPMISEWLRGKLKITREELAPNHGWRHL